MTLWFLRGLRTGIVTTRYPAELDAWTETLPAPPRFRPELLTEQLAHRLVEVCPFGALAREGDELAVDLGACTSCGLCVEHGAGAVVPGSVFQLASPRRELLVKRVPIRGGP